MMPHTLLKALFMCFTDRHAHQFASLEPRFVWLSWNDPDPGEASRDGMGMDEWRGHGMGWGVDCGWDRAGGG